MSIHLICLTSSGGIPIFIKKHGDCEMLPFSTVGSLNGIHLFCKSQNVQMETTTLKDGIIIWKEYEDTILLIGIAKGISENVLLTVLDLTFNFIVFSVGLNEVKCLKNVDKLKKNLKVNLPIIDVILEMAESEMLRYSDCILCSENNDILDKLNIFSEQIGSPFCFVLIKHKIAVGTLEWWELDAVERKLIVSLLNASSTEQKDVFIYLPMKSPNIAYRLVSVPILQGVNICVLCGAEPSYLDIENVVQQIWKDDMDTLKFAEQCSPRNFPASLQMDNGILGILLINKKTEKYVISRNIQMTNNGKRSVTGNHRLDILRTFFHLNVDVIDKYINFSKRKYPEKVFNFPESYWCSDYHKCHSLETDENLICVLYTASMPNHTMRIVTQRTLANIITETDICWM